MRVAFFSPMPPSRSGIADYSAALVEPLGRLVDLTIFADNSAPFDPEQFDLALYQIGNNPCHAAAYEAAIAQPGVVVMHEPNLHHLVADLTIARGDWDAYLEEAEYDGGPVALARAKRARSLEVGPDYDGLAMTRRILERARAVVVHSRYVEDKIRTAGFRGPLARIPHGAWIPEADRMAYRQCLGLDETTPLIGVFGFLKPYKRITESLRAFQRLLRVEPRAKMILAGEPHPDLPIEQSIRALNLSASVRSLGFTPVEDFTGYIAACDIVLNLRYPTVGETSGSLLRALGLGRCVLVSDVGAFQELPDDICLKVPVDRSEEDFLFECLSTMVARPGVAQELGRRAKQWVERECKWESVARQYALFLESVSNGSRWCPAPPQSEAPPPPLVVPPPEPENLLEWAPSEPSSRDYVDTHLTRLLKTLEITPAGNAGDRILEMGAYLQITPLLKTRLGYAEVRGCYYGPLGKIDHKKAVSIEGEAFECDLDLFDAERDTFPYADGYFATVLCCELLEHLAVDPMHMMVEINRILKRDGHLVLTTPNIGSLRAISAILQGYHPGFFPAYIRPSDDEEPESRHNREYTPIDIHLLLRDSGFEIVRLETGPFRDQPKPELIWVEHLLEKYRLRTDLRGDGIYAVGRKTDPVRSRYPSWLYSGPER